MAENTGYYIKLLEMNASKQKRMVQREVCEKSTVGKYSENA